GITITAGGAGYQSAPTVTFRDPLGLGSGATGIATIDGAGAVTGITITSGGAGYTQPPTIILAGGGFTTSAAATCTLGGIPTAPADVVLGIPADLLRRRPDVRRAERQAAAQCALIGVAQADFYPRIALSGSLGYSAQHFKNLFNPLAFNGTFGPSFQWEVLNYGRILNNVRLQDARFQELTAVYQNRVLVAQQEVENGVVAFLKAQQRAKLQELSVEAARKADPLSQERWKTNDVTFTAVSLIQQNKVQQEDTLAQAQGEIALGLIQVYRALGGGWQIRCTGCETPADRPNVGEFLPALPRAQLGPPS